MAHYIHGFIAQRDQLREAAASLGGAVVAPLRLGFGFLLVTEGVAGPDGPWPFESLRRLTAALAEWAAERSRRFPIAYIETNYFGTGIQAAVVWRDGTVAFGPELSESKWVDGQLVSPPYLDKAINRSLRLLGANRGAVVDEFDAVGLGRHRFDDDWVAEAAKYALKGYGSPVKRATAKGSKPNNTTANRSLREDGRGRWGVSRSASIVQPGSQARDFRPKKM